MNDDDRRAHDRHRHWVPAVVVASLALAGWLGADWVPWNRPLSITGPLRSRALFLVAGGCFLLSYYLPLHRKKPAVILLTLAGVGWVFGPRALAGFLAVHLLAFSTFHPSDPRTRRGLAGSALAALAAVVAASTGPLADPGVLVRIVTGTVAGFLAVQAAWRLAWNPLLETAARGWMQAAMAHAVWLYLGASLVWSIGWGTRLPMPGWGWLLWFWLWERTVMYRIDLKDGRLPADQGVWEYLAVFFSPALLSNFSWLNRIPKGGAYLAGAFLARDKNRVVLSGLRLFGLSFVFFAAGPAALAVLRDAPAALGMEALLTYDQVIARIQTGSTPGILAVWVVLLYEFLNFYVLWTGVAHLKVALWRLMGYDIETHFQKPFASTNLLEWWKRYSFYYREFLVQAFYYPVFLRFFRNRPALRIVTATVAAAGVGNLLFHIMEASLNDLSMETAAGGTSEIWLGQLRTFPYYLLLGLAIGLTQIWIIRRGRRERRPWTPGPRLALDVLSVAGTVGFFILIRPFHHAPLDHSLADTSRLVLAALGLGG